MAFPDPSRPSPEGGRLFAPPRGTRARLSRRAFFWPAFLPLIVLSTLLVNWVFLAQIAFAAPAASYSTPGHNTFQQFLQEGQKSKAPHGKASVLPFSAQSFPATDKKPQTFLPSAEPPAMKALTLTLSNAQTDATMAKVAGAQPQDLKGSDGHLEVLVPAGALDISHATTSTGKAPTGTLTLQVAQLHGHFINTFHMLGEYQFQIMDAAGQLVQGVVLRHPLTVIYHYQPQEIQSLQLDPEHLFMTWPLMQSSAHTTTALQATTSAGQPLDQAIPMINDPQRHTLTAQVSGMLASPTTTSTATSFGDDQSPPKPNFATEQGNSGNLGYSYPVQMAPGADGFAPQLQFTYSTAVPNNQHNPVQPAGDAGEGWSIGLGSITSSQINGTTYYSISGIDGVSDLLIPIPGQSGFYETQHISHLRIQQFTSSLTNQPCFHVWDTSGNYDEIGCTADSLQYYTNSSGRTNYRWDMDMTIAANQGPNTLQKQVRTHYQQDMETINGYTSVRDASIGQILYGYEPAGGSFTVVGTVDFLYRAPYTSASSNGIGEKFATAYGTNYQCTNPPQSTTMRCDDPITYNNATYGPINPPTVMSTMMLQKVETFVGDDSSTSHLDYSYALAYQATPISTCYDAYTFAEYYCAGFLRLMSITPTAYLQGNSHTLKPVNFGYTGQDQNLYIDTTEKASDNTTQYGGQTWWNYLNSYDDGNTGVGEQITYARAWNNTHGTPNASNGDDRHDPLYCTNNTDCTGSYANPNDRAWTVWVVTRIQNWGADSSSLTGATSTYQYQLAITGTGCPAAGSDTDCVGDTWLPSGDNNWMDYYDGQFQGFATVSTTSASGDLTVQHYYSNDGWGSATTNPVNYLSGNLLDEEVYSGNNTSGPLLEQTTNTYAGESNSSGSTPISCDTTVTTTYVPCETVLLSTQQTIYNGSSSANFAPYLFTSYAYDDYNPNASGTGLETGTDHYHNLTEEQIQAITSSGIIPCRTIGVSCNPPGLVMTKKWTYVTTDSTSSGWVYYNVNNVSESEIDDPSGHIWDCTTTKYDEGEPSGVPSPSTGWPTTVNTYSSANCASQTSPLTTTYTGYDYFGNQVATVDALGVANPSLYSSQGCVLSTAPAIINSTWSSGRYTSCITYDSLGTQPTNQANAFAQTGAIAYDSTQQDLPVSETDANSQTTTATYSYDTNGNLTIQGKSPQETGSYTSQSTQYSSCATSLPTSTTMPCLEEDKNSSLYPNAISRTFYDSQGRKVETRTPGPTSGDDTVVITAYNDQNHTVWQSVPFEVADGSGYLDPNGVKDINGNTPAGTTAFYDALGRSIAVKDPNFGSSQEPGIACSATLSGNYTSCVNYGLGYTNNDSTDLYEVATSIDPNGHETQSFTDLLNRVVATETYSGSYNGTLTLQRMVETVYNVLNKPTQVTVVDKAPQSGESISSVATSMTYDDLGRLLTENDPDQGDFSYTYDPDGHVLSVTQTTGSNSRTLGYNYDLLGRVGCEQTAAPTINATGACSAGSPLVQNTYDTTFLGINGTSDFPVGHLTQSVATTSYPDGTSATTTEQFQTSARGQR